MRDKLAYLIVMQKFTIFLSQTQLKVVSITYLYLHKFESKTTSNNVSMSHSHHSHVWCSYLFKLNLLTFSIDRDKLRIICIYDVSFFRSTNDLNGNRSVIKNIETSTVVMNWLLFAFLKCRNFIKFFKKKFLKKKPRRVSKKLRRNFRLGKLCEAAQQGKHIENWFTSVNSFC